MQISVPLKEHFFCKSAEQIFCRSDIACYRRSSDDLQIYIPFADLQKCKNGQTIMVISTGICGQELKLLLQICRSSVLRINTTYPYPKLINLLVLIQLSCPPNELSLGYFELRRLTRCHKAFHPSVIRLLSTKCLLQRD